MRLASAPTEALKERIRFVWRPQPGPQKALVDCPLSEIFYGGARGGGKTDGVLGKWALKEKRLGSAFNAVMFRKTTVSSEDAIERAKQIFCPLGAKFVGSPIPRFKMPNGGRVAFQYLDSKKDAEGQQGKNLSDVWIEEVGQYPTPEAIDLLWGALRGAGEPQMILTGNPGGPGQKWIAERFGLVPFPAGPKVVSRKLTDGSIHRSAVIPSRLTDNRILMTQDPGYLSRLHMSGGPALVKAWVDGDWSAIEGAYFPEWSEKLHVMAPFTVPADWTRIVSFDWGSARPFSVGWWGVAPHDIVRPEGVIPKGALVRFREWYGQRKDGLGRPIPNVGLKMTAEGVGEGIKERTGKERVHLYVADPAIFAEDGGPSIAERMPQFWSPADNKRVARNGAMGGWDLLRARLIGTRKVQEDGTLSESGRPMLYSFRTCVAFNQCIPSLQHDPTNAEDVDTKAEDHAGDEGRYACASRPWVSGDGKRGTSSDVWDDDDGDDESNWKTR